MFTLVFDPATARFKDKLVRDFMADLRAFPDHRLKLALKDQATLLAPISEGLPFLGFRVYPAPIAPQSRRAGMQ